MGRVINAEITERVNATDSVDADVILRKINLSVDISLAKQAVIANIILELTVNNAIKVTELISKIKELFADDPEIGKTVINIIISMKN